MGRVLRRPEGSPAGWQARARKPGRQGLGVGIGRRPTPSFGLLQPPPNPDSGNSCIYLSPSSALRASRPGRGGRPGGRGVGWRGGESQVQPRPGKFPFRPDLGTALLRGVLVPALATPEGEGESLGYFETLCQFPSIEGTPPLHPSPAPHPIPPEPFQGSELQPFPFEPPGWGDGLLFPFGKLFQGFFLADLLVTELFAMGKVEVNSGDISTGQVF